MNQQQSHQCEFYPTRVGADEYVMMCVCGARSPLVAVQIRQ